jgi:hypothetical protein
VVAELATEAILPLNLNSKRIRSPWAKTYREAGM